MITNDYYAAVCFHLFIFIAVETPMAQGGGVCPVGNFSHLILFFSEGVPNLGQLIQISRDNGALWWEQKCQMSGGNCVKVEVRQM